MKIYFAGNITPPREKLLLKANRLFSYYYHGKGKEFHDEFLFRIEKTKENKSK